MEKRIINITKGKVSVVMIMDREDYTISLITKKNRGVDNHDISEVYELMPVLAMEVLDRTSVQEPISDLLLATIQDIVDLAAEIDPWYEGAEIEMPLVA